MEHAGKTSLLQRFVLDQFSVAFGYRATLGASFLTKKIDLTDGADGSVTESCNIGVWDVAGTERFRSMSKFHFRYFSGREIVAACCAYVCSEG